MVHIDPARCSACGLCAEICPRRVIVHDGAAKTTAPVAARAGLCLDCGHCVAVCAKDAVSVDALPASAFTAAAPPLDPELVLGQLGRRRTVRRYKLEPVPRELLGRLAEAAALAPTISGGPAFGLIIVDRPEALTEVTRGAFALYRKLDKAIANPIARFFIKRGAGARFAAVRDFVLPAVRRYAEWYEAGEGNELLRDAPALLLLHASRDEVCGDETAFIAAYHIALLADALGLGTCINGLVPAATNKSPELQRLLGVPAGHLVHTSLTVGYPRLKLRKAIRRGLTEVRYV